MPVKILKTEQFLPISLDTAWDFFSSPRNLNEITPPNMTFKVLSNIPDKMYPGLMISYKVSPMFRIPLSWTTEITHVSEKKYFVDEQRIGPYNIWHHEHHFEAVKGGVMMRDILHYNIGKSFIGIIAGLLFIDAKVQSIFEYRYEKLEQMFGKQ
jgi:ligand-binding SRPBCC domain-containing protein